MPFNESSIVDCTCGLRYMKTAVATLTPEIGFARCSCGLVLERWSGSYRVSLEPEEGEAPEVFPQ